MQNWNKKNSKKNNSRTLYLSTNKIAKLGTWQVQPRDVKTWFFLFLVTQTKPNQRAVVWVDIPKLSWTPLCESLVGRLCGDHRLWSELLRREISSKSWFPSTPPPKSPVSTTWRKNWDFQWKTIKKSPHIIHFPLNKHFFQYLTFHSSRLPSNLN